MPDSCGGKAILWVMARGGAVTVASLPTCWHQPLTSCGRPREGGLLRTWCSEQQRRTPAGEPFKYLVHQERKDPSQGRHLSAWHAEQQRRTSQKVSLSASCLRLEKVYKCRGSCAWGCQGPCTLGTARVPAIQAAAPAPFLILSETKVPEARKYPSSPTSPVPVASGSPGDPALCSQLPHGHDSRSPLLQAARGWRKPWENHVSYSPELLLPCKPGAARGPETQVAAALPHLVLTGAEPSPPGQPREHTAMDNPHAEMEKKTTIEPQGQCGLGRGLNTFLSMVQAAG